MTSKEKTRRLCQVLIESHPISLEVVLYTSELLMKSPSWFFSLPKVNFNCRSSIVFKSILVFIKRVY